MDKQIYGLDLSANHWAVVKMDYETGRVLDYRFMTDNNPQYQKDKEHGILLDAHDKKNGESKENFDERRRAFSIYEIETFTKSYITHEQVYLCIEGYAYAASTRGLTQIAEITGTAKTLLYANQVFTRIHAPNSVKLFATGKGRCLKKDIVIAAQEQGLVFPKELIKKTTKKVKKEKVEEYDGSATDLADAFFLASILRKELLLRAGKITLESLSEGERRVFLRVTDVYPENVLARPFIHKD